ncbi:DUF4286 family protein [Solitalea koreensis]|uniref:DUF4286 domain-containing protein n=1 Tax=Solitalea koreensis TaxID=543615 RepID=A0A521AV10_9SPHI|nr:DUF4286 family protein [Solitalea koreensis]SMO38673.1 protein of unknown function [Solitalea koreensis]
MILYNVTINIEPEVHDEWLHWMRSIHIPDVLKTGLFKSCKICQLLAPVQENEEGMTYSFQYLCDSFNDYLKYEKEFAPTLRDDVNKKYANKIVAFRSILEVIEELK